MKIENPHLQKYLSGAYREIEGWLQSEVIWILDKLAFFQLENGIDGGFAEIGVHHGRFLAALENVTNVDRMGLAVDVFDDQHLNIDKSGKGNIDKFQENMHKYCRNSSRIAIKKLDSVSSAANKMF